MSAYTQKEIDELIASPKHVGEPPKREMKQIHAHLRNDMTLLSSGGIVGVFRVFMRRSVDFPENFSIGLIYLPNDTRGELTLLRCNGQHGDFNGSFDPEHPHYDYHVHRADERAIDAGLKPEKYAAITGEYASFEEALQYFLKLVGMSDSDVERYFPKKQQEFFFD